MFVFGLKKTQVGLATALLALCFLICPHCGHPYADEDEGPTEAEEDHEVEEDESSEEENAEEETSSDENDDKGFVRGSYGEPHVCVGYKLSCVRTINCCKPLTCIAKEQEDHRCWDVTFNAKRDSYTEKTTKT